MLSVAPPGVSAEIIEELTDGPQTPGPHANTACPPHQERESSYKKLGLTKQVLAAHTQKEEQAFLSRIRELRGVTALKADCSHYLERQRGAIASDGTEIHAHTHARTLACARRNTRMHIHVHMRMHACMHTFTRAHRHILTHVHARTYRMMYCIDLH